MHNAIHAQKRIPCKENFMNISRQTTAFDFTTLRGAQASAIWQMKTTLPSKVCS